jgi:hypothetical protein
LVKKREDCQKKKFWQSFFMDITGLRQAQPPAFDKLSLNIALPELVEGSRFALVVLVS